MTKTKLTTALTGAAIVAAAFAPAAFAQDVEVTDNGAFSHNVVETNNTNSNTVVQSNETTAVTTVSSTANTGGNNSSFNTGGSSSITTGAATNTTVVSVTGGDNTAVVADCGCLNLVPATVTIANNGAFSWNKVKTTNTNTKAVVQASKTTAVTTVLNKAKTGKNTSAFNTGPGASTVSTGPAANGTSVTVTGGSNASL